MSRRLVWPFAFNFFHFAAVAASMPFLVLHYQQLGFTGTQIGLLTGITPLVALGFTPVWTGLADRFNRHKLILGFLLLSAAAAFFIFPLFKPFLPVLIIAVTYNIFFGPLTSFSDSSAMAMLGDQKNLYGRVRLGGTIGYGIMALISGSLVQLLGLKAAFWSCSGLLLANFLVSRNMDFSETEQQEINWKKTLRLLANRQWFFFIVLAFSGGISLGVLNNYLFPLMRDLNASETAMGFALTIGTLAEVPVMIFGDRLLKRFGSEGLLKTALLITVVRLLLCFFAGTPTAILLIQLTNGMTFPAFWIAGVSLADENAPPGLHTTAQGIFNVLVWGVGNAAGGFAGGPLLEMYGSKSLFLVSGIVVLGILILVSVLQWVFQQNEKLKQPV